MAVDTVQGEITALVPVSSR